jgi:hypothetical protein
VALRQSIDVLELLGRSDADGQRVADLLRRRGAAEVQTEGVEGSAGFTDLLRVRVPGAGTGPTLGIIRPTRWGGHA